MVSGRREFFYRKQFYGVFMISEQRVKLMTRLAAYEENEGKRNSSIGTYFRSDYISLQLIKSFICASLAFCIILTLYILYDSEMFLIEIYRMDNIIDYVKKIGLYYLIFTCGYTLISYVVYAIRYRKARTRLRVYFNNLKRLQILYQRERKDKNQ